MLITNFLFTGNMPMRLHITAWIVALLVACSTARASVLVEFVDQPYRDDYPGGVSFYVGGPSHEVTLTIEGYQAVDEMYIEELKVYYESGPLPAPNLLGLTWDFTPGSLGSQSSQFADSWGTGTNALYFKTDDAIPDTFTISFLADQAGFYQFGYRIGNAREYVRNGTFTSNSPGDGQFNQPSLFRVSASIDQPVSGVPEPSSIALASVGLIGLLIARRRNAAR